MENISCITNRKYKCISKVMNKPVLNILKNQASNPLVNYV